MEALAWTPPDGMADPPSGRRTGAPSAGAGPTDAPSNGSNRCDCRDCNAPLAPGNLDDSATRTPPSTAGPRLDE